ncbi:MAG: Uma2 family endonuclease [Acidobacteria bacterium]|nr:Uma2 family endonuclease [Acidobacteriota bacterium]
MVAVYKPKSPELLSGDQCITLHGVTVETYRKLSSELGDRSRPRLFYCEGSLELVSPSPRHESLVEFLRSLVRICARLFKKKVYGFGSMTLERADGQAGGEPDAVFYLGQSTSLHLATRFRPGVDPAPDLVVEVDLSSSSQEKVKEAGLYAQLQIPEIWKYREGNELQILIFQEGKYIEQTTSHHFPDVACELLRQALNLHDTKDPETGLQWFEKQLKHMVREKKKQ